MRFATLSTQDFLLTPKGDMVCMFNHTPAG